LKIHKACCVKVKNCTGVVKGKLAAQGLVDLYEVVSGVESALLFALEHPEVPQTFDEQELVDLVDEQVEKAKGLPGSIDKLETTTLALMDFSTTI